MKHQPAGSGDGCAVYTMRQWVQASGNRPGLAPERERQELRPAQLTPGDKWLLGFLCTGMFWRKGYSTEYSGSAPLTFFSRSTLEGFTIQLCLPKSVFPTVSSQPGCLHVRPQVFPQLSCVSWLLPEESLNYRPAVSHDPCQRVSTVQLHYVAPSRGCLLNSPAVLYTT